VLGRKAEFVRGAAEARSTQEHAALSNLESRELGRQATAIHNFFSELLEEGLTKIGPLKVFFIPIFLPWSILVQCLPFWRKFQLFILCFEL
jgi:hypothetical protein